ncbi:MAG: protein kinase [Planctomycetota bacterium]
MSRPFLCACGSVLDVEQIPLGARFGCPACGSQRHLAAADPGLLAEHAEPDGIYDMLLKRRMGTGAEFAPAVLVSHDVQPAPRAAERLPVNSPPTEIVAQPRRAEALGLSPGDSLGPYRIERVLGQGGMGTVYEAFDQSLHRTIALKVLAEEHARNAEVVDRFQREARAAGSLTHPNITHIYSIGAERGCHYFAMEIVRGKTLAAVLHEERRLDDDRAADYLLQVARGLRVAKQKEIIHRDIKPSNLILADDGLVKITDFGLAKVVTSSVDITATGVIVGTPLYMSPEQGKGEPLDHRSDIYSLGCTFYHLVAGRAPFTGESAMHIIVRHITEDPPALTPFEESTGEGSRLARVIGRMMAKHAMDRFQTYDELIEAVTQAVSGATGSSSRVEATPSRVVIVTEPAGERTPGDSMSRKQLSIADVNLELGRHEKALALYHRVLEENPEMEVDLSFRMLQIHQARRDEEAQIELYRRILHQSTDPKERFFCRWKLLAHHYDRSLTEVRQARELLEQLLDGEIPSPVQERRLHQRLEHLKQLERRLSRDREAGITLVRKTGDLQIELD